LCPDLEILEKIAAIRLAHLSSLEQPLGDHLRLDLIGALKDREHTRVDEEPRRGVFDGETVAAVDLNVRVGGLPCRARRKELGHAGLEIAAPLLILFSRREEGELPRRLDPSDHATDLPLHAGELEDRPAKLCALLSVL